MGLVLLIKCNEIPMPSLKKYIHHCVMAMVVFVAPIALVHATGYGVSEQLAELDGNWYSPQWKYGYVMKDGVGIATSTNSAAGAKIKKRVDDQRAESE